MILLIWFSIIYVGCAVAVGVAARQRARSAVLYFLASLILSPILAIILLGISGGVKAPQGAPSKQ
jgi:hypothetical protein